MRIAFRADASIQIGTGHVMRCLTLAEEMRRQGHQCLFICRNHEGHLADLIAQKGFELHLLGSPPETSAKFGTQEPALTHADWLGVPWQTDASQTLEVHARNATDWLIVDHYALDVNWERSLAEAVGQVMVIDDLADREHECAVLLDQNLGRESVEYEALVPRSCTKLIGPQYALLRPEFAELRPTSLERRHSPELKRILISLGGVDRTNVTGQVLEVLSNSTLPPETELDIVMGGSAPYLEAVKRQASGLFFRATVSVNVSDMAERMCRADLAIGAAGSTSWERSCVGLPTIMLVLADNQKSAAKALSDLGAVITATNIDEVGEALRHLLKQSKTDDLAKLAEISASLIDGLGVARVAGELSRRG